MTIKKQILILKCGKISEYGVSTISFNEDDNVKDCKDIVKMLNTKNTKDKYVPVGEYVASDALYYMLRIPGKPQHNKHNMPLNITLYQTDKNKKTNIITSDILIIKVIDGKPQTTNKKNWEEQIANSIKPTNKINDDEVLSDSDASQDIDIIINSCKSAGKDFDTLLDEAKSINSCSTSTSDTESHTDRDSNTDSQSDSDGIGDIDIDNRTNEDSDSLDSLDSDVTDIDDDDDIDDGEADDDIDDGDDGEVDDDDGEADDGLGKDDLDDTGLEEPKDESDEAEFDELSELSDGEDDLEDLCDFEDFMPEKEIRSPKDNKKTKKTKKNGKATNIIVEDDDLIIAFDGIIDYSILYPELKLQDMNDLYSKRNSIIDNLNKLLLKINIPNSISMSRKLEQGIYNSTIDKCNQRGFHPMWINPQFNELYICKYKTVYTNLDIDSYVKNIGLVNKITSGELTPERIAFLKPSELFPEKWMAILDEELTKDKIMSEGGGSKTSFFPCPKCKEHNASYYQLQTRSADEPMTVFFTCLNKKCGNMWKC